MLHKMTKNGPLPRTRADAELKLLEQPQVNWKDLMEQLRSGCRLRKRDDQTLDDLVATPEWQQRNEELTDMYNALTGQAMDCLLRPIVEDEVLYRWINSGTDNWDPEKNALSRIKIEMLNYVSRGKI